MLLDATAAAPPLAEALARLRPDWQIAHETDPDSAARRVATERCDALLADFDGHDTSPIAAARALRHAQPAALRLFAVRAHDENATRAALALGHRVLARPLSASAVVEAIERAGRLGAEVGSEAVRAMIGRIERLPPAPRLFLELSALIDDPRSDATQVGKVVAQDPALTAKLLQLCNSALYAGGRPISDVRHAVTRLGWRTLATLALAAEVFGGADGAARDAAQRRALLASRLAERIVVQPAEAEAAATAALLADVALLLPGLGDDHARLADPRSDALPLHAAAGAFLLGLWGLPPAIAEAVALHHAPARGGERFGVVGAVHVAVGLACAHALDEEWLARVGVGEKLARWRVHHQTLLQDAG